MRMHSAWLLALMVPFAWGQAPSAPVKEWTLLEAVEYALEHSPELKTAVAEIRRREAVVTSTRSSLLPQLDLSADLARSRFDRGYPLGTPPDVVRYDSTLYAGGIELKYMVWDFHRTELEIQAAKERVQAASELAERRRQEVIFEVARLYLQAETYQDLIEAAESRRKSLQALLEKTSALVGAGRAVPVDALKVKTRIAQIESDLATLEAGRRAAMSALASSMGLEGELGGLRYQAPAEPAATAPPEAAQTAISQRFELRAQGRETLAAERQIEAIRRSAWPRIDFRASAIQYGSNTPQGFATLIGNLLPSLHPPAGSPGNAVTDWLVGAHVSFPLFDGGRRKGQSDAALAQWEQSRLAEQQLRLRIRREVASAEADLKSALSRERSLRESVGEAEQVLRNERWKFEAGRSVINFVLDAESALLTNQSLLYQSRRSATIASIALDLSIGNLSPATVQGR